MPNFEPNPNVADSFSAYAQETPAQKLANEVNKKVAQNLLEAAYADLKKGVNAQVADMPLDEKKAFWSEVENNLNPGAMTKLSSVFLNENFSRFDSNNDGTLKKSELSGLSSALDPFYKGLGSELLKNFDVAANLSWADASSIDATEAKNFRTRQVMPSHEVYTDAVIDNIIRKLGEPVKPGAPGTTPESQASQAMKYLTDSMTGRSSLETSEESQVTWKELSEKLQQHGLVEKLSMAYLKESREHLQKKADTPFSMKELSILQQSINPVRKQFATYIADNFKSIAEVRLSDPLNLISEEERQVYERKMLKPKGK